MAQKGNYSDQTVPVNARNKLSIRGLPKNSSRFGSALTKNQPAVQQVWRLQRRTKTKRVVPERLGEPQIPPINQCCLRLLASGRNRVGFPFGSLLCNLEKPTVALACAKADSAAANFPVRVYSNPRR